MASEDYPRASEANTEWGRTSSEGRHLRPQSREEGTRRWKGKNNEGVGITRRCRQLQGVAAGLRGVASRTGRWLRRAPSVRGEKKGGVERSLIGGGERTRGGRGRTQSCPKSSS